MKELLIVAIVLAAIGIAQAELMPDGGFESGMWSGHYGKMSNGAFSSSYTWGRAYAYQGTVSPYSGNYYGVFRMPASGYLFYYSSEATGGDLLGWFPFTDGWITAWQDGIEVSGGDVIQASAYVKELNANPDTDVVKISIYYKDSGGYSLLIKDIEYFDVTAGWTKIVGSAFTAPAGTAQVILAVGMEDAGVGHTVGIDNVALSAPGACHYKLAGDLDDNCKVDLFDIALLVANWLTDCELTPGDDPACVLK